MAYLKKERAISEGIAALDALAAPDAKRLVNRVLVEGLLHEPAADGAGGAKLVFGPRIECWCTWLEISETEPAVSAKLVGVKTFYGRRRKHAVSCTPATLGALYRVNLPDLPARRSLAGKYCGKPTDC